MWRGRGPRLGRALWRFEALAQPRASQKGFERRGVQADAVELEREMDKYLWIIDPLGNLIMYYPGQDTDPVRFRNDIAKLLHVSVIG